MEKGTAYIENTAKTFISVTNTLHAEVDEQDATASEVRQKFLYITHILSCKICYVQPLLSKNSSSMTLVHMIQLQHVAHS